MPQISIQFIAEPSMTREEQSLLASATEGRTLVMPPEMVQNLRAHFEHATRFASFDKFQNMTGNAIFATIPPTLATLFASAPSSFSIPFIAGLTAYALTMSAVMGKKTISLADRVIERGKSIYESQTAAYFEHLQGAADHYARVNYVSEMNYAVLRGENVSLSDLGKLVKINNAYLHTACEKLAIAVMQAKLMIGMQDKKIAEFAIANHTIFSADAPDKDAYLKAILLDQFQTARILGTAEPNEHDMAAGTPPKTQWRTPAQPAPATRWTIGGVLSAIHNYYVDGIAGNLRVFQKPKADKYLPTTSLAVTVGAFETVPDLAERIERYGAHKLDLPALAR